MRKPLGLSARDAARRFTSRRIARETWRPVALLWRRRQKRLASAPAGRIARTVNNIAFSQLHVHFATYLNDRVRTERVFSTVAPREQQTRVESHRHFNDNRRTAIHLQPSRAQHPSSTAGVRNERRVPAAVPPILRSPKPSVVSVVRQETRRRMLVERSSETVRTAERHEQHTSRTHTQIRRQSLQLIHRRVPATVQDVARVSHKQTFSFEHAEELVWRRVARMDPVDETREPQRATAVHPSPARSGATQDMGAAPRNDRIAASHPAKFDPALLDRLTDDVIRRVEQRIRIERERRGL